MRSCIRSMVITFTPKNLVFAIILTLAALNIFFYGCAALT